MPATRRPVGSDTVSYRDPTFCAQSGNSTGSKNGFSNMKYVILAAVAALAVGGTVTAHAASEPSPYLLAQPARSGTPEGGNSVTALNALLAEWDQAGFSTPSKPSQYRVYGGNGHVTNGEGYNYMVSLIRSAVSNIREGRTRDAATKIAEARRVLATTNPLRLASQ
jgi:hypothetical protein